MPLVQTRGAASAQGFGEFAQASGPANYIEDVFSTYLYTGTSAAQTITNGIDLSTKGGLVWFKSRSNTYNHQLIDTARTLSLTLATNNALAQFYNYDGSITSFNTDGFSLGTDGFVNNNTKTFASWTLRKQPKFFDIQTWTGSGANRTISHLLGSVPACIIVKRLDSAGDWQVYHRSLANTEYLVLNTTAAKATGATRWNSTTPTSTVFSIGTDATVNASGGTYVAYIFASDSGGFGLTGTDNVISCGSFTTDGSGNATVTLGYEPQWVMFKRTDSSTGGDWLMLDNMRGFTVSDGDPILKANSSAAENTSEYTNPLDPTATGFTQSSGGLYASATYIYIAIRRGPMKVPTSGTSVFSPNLTTTNNTITTNFPVDLSLFRTIRASATSNVVFDRLRGAYSKMFTNTADADDPASSNSPLFDSNTGTPLSGYTAGLSGVDWAFRRAPSFFDEVCWTGTNADQTINHNLGVVPEMIIFKDRTNADVWRVGTNFTSTNWLSSFLNTTAVGSTLGYAAGTRQYTAQPTATQFFVGQNFNSYSSTVAYLFATCAGVSKVGSYTGNGSTQTIDCGFGAGGARFVLIKRTDSTGDWYVYDTARGMTTLTDPYLLLNSTATEAATLGSVTTVSTGFALNATILSAINTNAASYIFLAIA